MKDGSKLSYLYLGQAQELPCKGNFVRNVFSQIHTFILWALMSAIFWGWIFTLITDAPAEKKITIYCCVPEILDTELAVELEKDKPEGIRMIQVHNFEYVLFDMGNIEYGDIFILPESQIGEYEELLLSRSDGIKVYDARTRTGAAAEYLSYEDEDYFLFLGARSVHIGDGKAEETARRLLSIGASSMHLFQSRMSVIITWRTPCCSPGGSLLTVPREKSFLLEGFFCPFVPTSSKTLSHPT